MNAHVYCSWYCQLHHALTLPSIYFLYGLSGAAGVGRPSRASQRERASAPAAAIDVTESAEQVEPTVSQPAGRARKRKTGGDASASQVRKASAARNDRPAGESDDDPSDDDDDDPFAAKKSKKIPKHQPRMTSPHRTEALPARPRGEKLPQEPR